MENLQLANQAAEPPILANTATKAELLSRAKDAIEAGDQSMRDAAEALAIAQELHGASQAEMARAVGKSEAWVSLLLQWRRTEFKAESPFGPTTKAARLKHAEDRAASGASKPRKPCKVSIKPKADADAATLTSTDANRSTCTNAEASAHALAELKREIDHLVPLMDHAAEVADYLLTKIGEEVS
jgi:hypothetical protein